MSEIVSIVYKPQHADHALPDRYARVPLEKARLIEDYGIEGDRKGGHPNRNLNIMSLETLNTLRQEGYKTGPGEMGEQIVVSGVDVQALQPGDRMQIGGACVEVINLRTGCERYERIQGFPRKNSQNRVGVMARVVTSGHIHVGDPVVVLEKSKENV